MLLGRWAQGATFPRVILLATLALVLSLVTVACSGTVSSKQLYEMNCAECHGDNGNRLPIARLDSKDFLIGVGEAGLVAATKNGKGAMPAWGQEKGGPLDDQQIMAIVQYLETGKSQSVKSVQTKTGGNDMDELLHNPAVLMVLFTLCMLGFLWTMNRVTAHS